MDTVTSEHPALAYAEVELGVHKVWEDALLLTNQLDELYTDLDKAQDARRALDQQLEDAEMDLLVSERSKHPDHTEAAFTRHLKEVRHKNQDLKTLQLKRNAKAGECSGIELDVEYTKARIRIFTARMEQLGGYLNYLAAVKNAEPPPVVYSTAQQAESTS